MNRITHINQLIRSKKYKSYLEIGIGKGRCFNSISAPKKTGVDPDVKMRGVVSKTSDAFFKANKDTFDIIFIDGLHEAEQVEKDIVNSMKVLNKGGIILIHDISPPTEESQEVPKVSSPWKGTVWRAFVGFRKKYPGIKAYTLSKTDTGLGVIEYSDEEVEEGFISKIQYKTFDKKRDEYLGIID